MARTWADNGGLCKVCSGDTQLPEVVHPAWPTWKMVLVCILFAPTVIFVKPIAAVTVGLTSKYFFGSTSGEAFQHGCVTYIVLLFVSAALSAIDVVEDLLGLFKSKGDKT